MKITHANKIFKFLKENGDRTVALGDIFDYKRNNVSNYEEGYLNATERYHKLIRYFVGGNHDFYFVKKHRSKLREVLNLVNVKGNTLFFHGHQLFTGFYTKEEWRYLKYYNGKPNVNLLTKVEWFLCKNFAEYFMPNQSKAKEMAQEILTKCEHAGLLEDKVNTIVTGHTHLPYDVNVKHRGKEYRVANCGSGVKGSRFKPIYVEDIDTWFISDLHLGTEKTLCQ